jgi:uncharacterized membrane protein HdeD (DUF308 family)
MSETATTGRPDPLQASLAGVARSWGLVLLAGLITIGFGIALLAWPDETLLVVAALIGIWLISTGVLGLVGAFAPDVSGGTRALFGVTGILSLVIGIALVKNVVGTETSQARALSFLALLIGLGWLINGIGELFGAISSPEMQGRGWAIFQGLLGIIAGVVVLVWPLNSLAVLATIAGILLLIVGFARVVAAFWLRSQRAKTA